jgi:hypothetical protein
VLSAAIFLGFASVLAQAADGVSVMTDAPAYPPGAPIQITLTVAGPDRISRGGIACDDVSPLALEQLSSDGSWQPVDVAQHTCIGIAAELLSPGDTQQQTIKLPLDVGTYHVLYAFDDIDNGIQDVSISDPFDVAR